MSLQSTDPIADLLTRIRNGAMVGKTAVKVPASKIKQNILAQLKAAGYIDDFTVGKEQPSVIEIAINDSITEIKRLSKPGRRMYVGANDIPKVKNGRGMVLVSTSKGIMTGEAAKKSRLGGELLLEVY